MDVKLVILMVFRKFCEILLPEIFKNSVRSPEIDTKTTYDFQFLFKISHILNIGLVTNGLTSDPSRSRSKHSESLFKVVKYMFDSILYLHTNHKVHIVYLSDPSSLWVSPFSFHNTIIFDLIFKYFGVYSRATINGIEKSKL